MKTDDIGVCLLIGDLDNAILKKLGSLSCSIEMGGLAMLDEDGDAKAFQLCLDTKYYSVNSTIWTLPTFSSIKPWEARHADENICSLIVVVNHENDISYLQELAVYCKKWNAEIQILSYDGNVLKDERALDIIIRWTIQESFEFVNLHPDKDEIEDLESFNEKIGVERIFELITTTSWPSMTIKADPTKRPEQQRRLRRLIDEDVEQQSASYFNFPQSNFVENNFNGPILIRKSSTGEKRSTKDIEMQEKIKNMLKLTAEDLPDEKDEAMILKAFMTPRTLLQQFREHQIYHHYSQHGYRNDASNTILFFHPSNTFFPQAPFFTTINNDHEENPTLYARPPIQFIRAQQITKDLKEETKNDPVMSESKKAKRRKQKKARQKERVIKASDYREKQDDESATNPDIQSTMKEMNVFNTYFSNKDSSHRCATPEFIGQEIPYEERIDSPGEMNLNILRQLIIDNPSSFESRVTQL